MLRHIHYRATLSIAGKRYLKTNTFEIRTDFNSISEKLYHPPEQLVDNTEPGLRPKLSVRPTLYKRPNAGQRHCAMTNAAVDYRARNV